MDFTSLVEGAIASLLLLLLYYLGSLLERKMKRKGKKRESKVWVAVLGSVGVAIVSFLFAFAFFTLRPEGGSEGRMRGVVYTATRLEEREGFMKYTFQCTLSRSLPHPTHSFSPYFTTSSLSLTLSQAPQE